MICLSARLAGLGSWKHSASAVFRVVLQTSEVKILAAKLRGIDQKLDIICALCKRR